jgi:photosystem I subunit XI
MIINNTTERSLTSFDIISSFENDPFVGHLSTPITSSNLTKNYLNLLPIYQTTLSPLLKGITIGFTHGYFLLGPFVKLGPLRHNEISLFIGLLATISLIIILTTALIIYGIVTFSKQNNQNSININIFSSKGWNQFTSGFIIGGFTGSSIAYSLLKYFLN